MLSYSTMTLVDTLFVGRLGSAALAGVGLGGIATWALICFALGLLRGAKVLVSQAVGAAALSRSAGRARGTDAVREQVGQITAVALLYALGLGLAAVALGQLLAVALPPLAASAAAGAAATDYFGARLIGAPVVFLFWALREVRQGLGDARSPMVASVSANVVNAALDYAMIFGLGLGVSGAALASVLASVVELSVLLAYGRTEVVPLRSLRARHLAAMWWIGWPAGLELLVEMGSFAALSAMISRHGELQMAAHQIALQVIHFSFLPAFALAEATCVLVGQAVGARRLELVRQVSRLSLAVGALYTGACSLLFALGGGMLAHAFCRSDAVATVVIRLLLVAAVFQVFDAAATIARGALRGTGDVRYPAVVGTLAAWLLMPPAMWWLGYRMGLGAVGGWIGICAELVLTSALFWWRLEHGSWRAASAGAELSLASRAG